MNLPQKGNFHRWTQWILGFFFGGTMWDPHPRWIPVKPEVRSLILGYRVSASGQICCWVVSCAIYNHRHISAFHEQQLWAVACHSKKNQTWPSSQTFTWSKFQPPQMVAGADTVGTQKGTPWNAWWNGENWALRQVWPIIQTPGYIYIYTYIYIYWII